MLKFRCKDTGFKCRFVTIGSTKEAVTWTVIEHLIQDHGIKLETIPPKIKEKISSAIHVRGT
ncbi:MAG: hypothetical protein AUI61_02175 [Thaumarchaeota archaeon 13_1_40CM_2_39_13_2]|nr:MAG: hypothetical protein AUI61_02175 [Thaumarchaeota archaeon 13_1_40CM_2_39_13_2]